MTIVDAVAKKGGEILKYADSVISMLLVMSKSVSKLRVNKPNRL